MTYISGHLKLKKISSYVKQLWPVVYVNPNDLEKSLNHDLEIVVKSSCDAAVIELGKDPNTLSAAIYFAKKQFPQLKLGVNYLGGHNDLYGYVNSFQIASKYELPIVWTDFSGVDLIHELDEVSLHEIESHRLQSAFYCSGIHMKYGTLRDKNKPIELSALQAMGWVDGLIVTGGQTGEAASAHQLQKVRSVTHDYPIGIASGITLENIKNYLTDAQFFLVNTGIADKNHRLIFDKTRALAELIHFKE